MTSGQKIAFSLLGTMILFAGFFVFTQSELFTQLETRYYSQAKIREKVDSLDKISEGLDSYITKFLTYVSEDKDSYLNNPAIVAYLRMDSGETNEVQQRILTEELLKEFPEITGIRIIDKDGRNVHFSTFEGDILKQIGLNRTYKFYQEILKDQEDEVDFNHLAIPDEKTEHRVIMDEKGKRILISLPLKFRNTYSAAVVFYFNLDDIQKQLIDADCLLINQNFTAFGNEDGAGGFIVNIPSKYLEDFNKPLRETLNNTEKDAELSINEPVKILEIEDKSWGVITSKRKGFFKIGGVYTLDIFRITQELKYLMYGTVGLTIFLVLFLLFSLRPDKKIVIRKKIKRIQYGIISEYLDNKEKIEWNKVVDQLKSRQNDLSLEILRSVGIKNKKKAEKLKLDKFLEQNWEQIFAVIAPETSQNNNAVSGISLDDLRRVIEDVLKGTKLNVQVDNVVPVESVPKKETAAFVSKPVSNIEVVEAVEEISDVEEIEEITEAVEIDPAENLDEVEEIEEVEAVEDIDEVEEIEEVEAVEDIDEVEEIEEVETVEDIDEVEEIEEVEAVEDIDEVEEIEEVEAVEDIDEVEEIEEVEVVEDIDEVEEIEEVEEIAPQVLPSQSVVDPLAIAKALTAGPQYEYAIAKDSFIRTDKLPTVENLFGEELILGNEYVSPVKDCIYNPEFIIKKYIPELTINTVSSAESVVKTAPVITARTVPAVPKIPADDTTVIHNSNKTEEIEELEELCDGEEILPGNSYFSMTEFGVNYEKATELKGVVDSIVERDGVFSIADNLDYSGVKLDAAFKSLVDSVIR